jgi:iron complex transport system ATP-binding protein
MITTSEHQTLETLSSMPTAPVPALMAFEGVSFRYPGGDHEVLDAFDLEIPSGTITAILGPNGTGKTTLLHLATGWLKPQGGRICLHGTPLAGYPRQEMGRWIGLVPQSEHIPYDFTLLEYALLGRAPYLRALEMPSEKDFRVAEHALQRVGMGTMLKTSVLALSGGEKQMAMIARTLAQQPRLLLLDEPTAHLDLCNKSRLAQLLKEFAGQGMTIVLTTHEPEFAAAVASHLVLMRRGQVLQCGALEKTLTAENLTQLYGRPVDVLPHNGRKVVVWN